MFRAYLTNMTSYAAGRLVGAWVEFPATRERLAEAYDQLDDGYEDPEYFWTDFECDECPAAAAHVGEFETSSRLNQLAEFLEELEEIGEGDKLTAYLECISGDVFSAIDTLDNYTFYPGYSMVDVAEELVGECYDLPEFALMYFDYTAFARDLSFEGYCEASVGVIAS